jgi:nitrite reductase/ring-hydroxylating ferredoxin subunit
MADLPQDPRSRIDVRIDSPGREGLTGTAPANVYAPAVDREQITIPPDFTSPESQPVWRQDFPIDWPQDQYVERRDFMKFMVLTSGAFAVGQLWIALQSWWRHRRGSLPGRRIAAVQDVAVGQSLMFNYPGEEDSCLLVRLGAAEFVAFSQKCTHLSCAVIPRPDQQIFYCPCHEGRFDLRSGAPISGPPRRPLPRILLAVRDGEIYATGVEERTV